MPKVRVSGAARWTLALLGAAAIAGAGKWMRALTTGGALAATAVGAVTIARGGLPASAALVVFFVGGSALSRFKQAEKARRGVLAQAKGGERDAWQVLANGGAGALCLALFGERGAGGFLGALGTAAADTWATELGLLARSRPRLIATMQPVAPGASGGITPEGTVASAVGALTVATAWAVAGGAGSGVLLTGLGAGVLGALVDSLLGATVQAEYWCAACGEPTETATHSRCGNTTALARGVPWVDNDVVNAASTAAGSILGALLFCGVSEGTTGKRRWRWAN